MKYLFSAIIFYLLASNASNAARINGDSDFYPRIHDSVYSKKNQKKEPEKPDLWQSLTEQEREDLAKEGIYNPDQLSADQRTSLERDVKARTPAKKPKGGLSNSNDPFRQRKFD